MTLTLNSRSDLVEPAARLLATAIDIGDGGTAEQRRVLELCRHPLTDAQVARVDAFAAAIGEPDDTGLELARDLVEKSRAEAARAHPISKRRRGSSRGTVPPSSSSRGSSAVRNVREISRRQTTCRWFICRSQRFGRCIPFLRLRHPFRRSSTRAIQLNDGWATGAGEGCLGPGRTRRTDSSCCTRLTRRVGDVESALRSRSRQGTGP